MTTGYEDLWSRAANDGASSMTNLFAPRNENVNDAEHLLAAWFRERSELIECSFVLEEARRMISVLLADGEITTKRRRQANRLIHRIQDVKKPDRHSP